jgi:hypothetical protein
MKLSQKEIIVKHLNRWGGWMPEYLLRSVSTNFGWIGSQGDRRVRELVEEGILEHRINGKYAEVRYVDKTITEGPVENRTEGGQNVEQKLFDLPEEPRGPNMTGD